MRPRLWPAILATTLCLCSLALRAERLANAGLQVEADANREQRMETFSIRNKSTENEAWIPALTASGSVIVNTAAGMHACSLQHVAMIEYGLLLTGDCGIGSYEQRITLTAEQDVLDVTTRLQLVKPISLHSVEDRYDFAPARHATVDEHTGPLDFVWSQNIKSEAGDLIPTNGFKSPVVMMQQGSVFAALMPILNDHHAESRALDLDVTTGAKPWMSYGAVVTEPHGHSYFRRTNTGSLPTISRSVEYRYSILLSSQPERLGYRRATRLLWQRMGHPALLASPGAQQNVLRPELRSFHSWKQDAWDEYANRVYTPVECGAQPCGTLKSNRNYTGDWQHPAPDAWFNAWFQSLRTAYGWYLHAKETNDTKMMTKAESVLNLALTSPRKQGAFSTIYLVNEKQWLSGDGWAGYADSYQTFSMSWTAYWMLRWVEDLTPQRKQEVLAFVKSYGDFLIAQQQPSGVIPSWFLASTMQPREEFRTFNAETAPSALLLAELAKVSGDAQYTAAAEKAMAFITREVVPRQRWFDYETYLSCARKDYGFFDTWTAQYPQNNLAELQAPQAMLALYQLTGRKDYLARGTEMLDYVLLTQQVWNNPLFTPALLGGFTTQNTDAEWSDARQSYAATLLGDYYQVTGRVEYLERAVAAARSTFAVAPWENWAHTGHNDEPGALTGFHWGTGSAMASVEMLQPLLGDGLIDADAGQGVCFDECTITAVEVQRESISFHIASPDTQRAFRIRFRGLDPRLHYRIHWNGEAPHTADGATLLQAGMTIGTLAASSTAP